MKKMQSIILIFFVQFLFGQEEIIPVRRTPYLFMGARYQAWRIQYVDYPINQICAPLTLIVPVGDRLQFQVANTPAATWWQEKRSITGPSDTWIQGSMIVGDNLGVINLGIGTPTGKTELNNDQFEISLEYLSRNIFEFGLPVYGQGMTIKAGALFAQKISSQVILGVGGQYLKRGSYKPINAEIPYQVGDQVMILKYSPKYQPGDEVTGQLGVDVLVTKDFKLMFDAMYTYYSKDLLDGEEVFESGQKLVFKSCAYYRYEDKYAWGQFLYRYKGKNEIRQGLTFTEGALNTTGYQCEVNLFAQYSSVENAKLYARVDGKFYGENELGKNGANIIGGGAGIQFQATPKALFDFCVKYMAGTYNDNIVEGLDISFGLGIEL